MAIALTSEDTHLMEPECWEVSRTWDTIHQLEQRIMTNKHNFESYMALLMSRSHVLQLFISASSDAFFSFLQKKVEETFPRRPEHFSDSVSSRLLSHLSLSLLFLDYPSGVDVPSNLSECRLSVELSKPVLEALPTLVFADDLVVEDDDEYLSTRKRQKSQRQKKQSRHSGKSTNDEVAFRSLGIDTPSSPQEAERLGRDVLQEQKEILSLQS
ncbi:hypothetical protein NEOLEDRAFT_375908 [Neolentinus lepideus HHB14362 ss-1]|uniref:Uncharacterized protein n=1 Tax=Neolentinus lepideus HHB14362 ss-1 TaxID=1314782 RepID=A0A165SJC3_9AGAM|nr:hypothetical protein NEOLEDRAFT_375908 [Neolentinus lepideus HHB14362 ss-1]